MAEKQSLNATFFAFRKREKGGVLLMATLAYIAVATVVFGGFAWLNWGAFQDYVNWITTLGAQSEQGGGPSPDMIMPPSSVMALGPMWFLFQVVYYVLFAAYEAACLRWLIRGETGGLFGLSLGADTWRVYFTYWIWLFLFIAYFIILFALGIGLGGAALFGAQGGGAEALGSMGIAALLAGLLWLIGMIYFAVRFAPAAATSIAKRRFAFFDAWIVTKDRFWPLFGSFLLLFVMYCVAYLIVSTVAGFAMVGGMMATMQDLGGEPTPEQMLGMFASPQVWIPLAIIYGVALVGAFLWMIAMFGVNARAAQAALEEGKIQAAD
jgi:hypothetical protein